MTPTPTAIDLYHGDTVTSFSDLASAAIQRVIHKATEGATDVDPAYASRMPEALAAGLKWEAYHFWRPDVPQAQAENFLNAVHGLYPNALSGYWLDYEVAGGTPAAIIGLMQIVNDEAPNPMGLYTTRSLAEALAAEATMAQREFFASCLLWLAEPGVDAPRLMPQASLIWPKISLWQYTWSGKIKGVTGNVDLNCIPT